MMPLPMREQIMQAILTRLQAIEGVTIARTPDTEFDENDIPAIAVIDGGHSVDYTNAGLLIYETTVSVELFVKSDGDTTLGTEINNLYDQVMSVIFADPTLGGLVIAVRETELDDPEIGRIVGQSPNAGAVLRLNIQFMTSDNSVLS